MGGEYSFQEQISNPYYIAEPLPRPIGLPSTNPGPVDFFHGEWTSDLALHQTLDISGNAPMSGYPQLGVSSSLLARAASSAQQQLQSSAYLTGNQVAAEGSPGVQQQTFIRVMLFLIISDDS